MMLIWILVYLIIGVLSTMAAARINKVPYDKVLYVVVAILWLPFLVYLAFFDRGAKNDEPNE